MRYFLMGFLPLVTCPLFADEAVPEVDADWRADWDFRVAWPAEEPQHVGEPLQDHQPQAKWKWDADQPRQAGWADRDARAEYLARVAERREKSRILRMSAAERQRSNRTIRLSAKRASGYYAQRRDNPHARRIHNAAWRRFSARIMR